MIARLIFPLALPELYTYKIPSHLEEQMVPGIRVEVSLRDKLYSALVYELLPDPDKGGITMKEIISVIDEFPIVGERHMKLWSWMARYYMCSLGEVMQMALPGGLKLESETKIVPGTYDYQDVDLSNDEFMVAEAVSVRNEITIREIQLILNKKTIYPVLRSLLSKEVVEVGEELIEKYSAKKTKVVSLTDALLHSEEAQTAALDSLKRARLQEETLLQIFGLSGFGNVIPVQEIYALTGSTLQVLKALEKKGFIHIREEEVTRITTYEKSDAALPPLSLEQVAASQQIAEAHATDMPVLVYGVTGSGKTRLYVDEIKKVLSQGRQVLFLLPEIALTTQMVDRIHAIFGEDLMVYHSKMNGQERVEVWTEAARGRGLVLGARSALFLPFKDLGLIIVDEEHDASYKQNNPAPRYNARDCAIAFANIYQAKVILGSATPSLESFENAHLGKYRLVVLKERYGQVKMPEIRIIDMAYEKRANRVKSLFSLKLLEAMAENLERKKQTIVFQNRRGYAPIIQCTTCGYTEMCPNCDVHLTLHRYFEELRCHYCNHKKRAPRKCPDCGNEDLKEIGAGTERIEQELKMHFPSARIGRLDFDTAKTKSSFEKIISAFAANEFDILIGTQMVTKGFDFDHVTLVGIVNADAMLMFPDFRANERAYQMMTQVAGRAGRRAEQGVVFIQAYRADHPVMYDIRDHQFLRMFHREIDERSRFGYPPFFRLITLELKHRDVQYVDKAANMLTEKLQARLGKRVLGPAIPGISMIKNLYIRTISVKFEKDPKVIQFVKQLILQAKSELFEKDGIKGVRINIDVDPY